MVILTVLYTQDNAKELRHTVFTITFSGYFEHLTKAYLLQRSNN